MSDKAQTLVLGELQMNNVTQPFLLVCVMAAGVFGGWMAAFVASVVCMLGLIWREFH